MKGLTISYNQLFVTNENIQVRDIIWTDADLQNGYVTFQGGIVFEAQSNYSCEISVIIGKFVPKKEALRTVTVPFRIMENSVAVYSVLSEKFSFPVPNGLYTLSVQALPMQKPTDDELYRICYELYFTASYMV
ncbi:competence protein ComJ [Ectobacillus sp. sgz5001026]|uniref:competence protein ComJ n=1 Tax=Ectobacillus sp. sgz5001026 TaxID=3242473 RepID=UPI0036D3CADC